VTTLRSSGNPHPCGQVGASPLRKQDASRFLGLFANGIRVESLHTACKQHNTCSARSRGKAHAPREAVEVRRFLLGASSSSPSEKPNECMLVKPHDDCSEDDNSPTTTPGVVSLLDLPSEDVVLLPWSSTSPGRESSSDDSLYTRRRGEGSAPGKNGRMLGRGIVWEKLRGAWIFGSACVLSLGPVPSRSWHSGPARSATLPGLLNRLRDAVLGTRELGSGPSLPAAAAAERRGVHSAPRSIEPAGESGVRSGERTDPWICFCSSRLATMMRPCRAAPGDSLRARCG